MGSGIHVDAWAKVDGDCSIECDVIGDETQMRFGGQSCGLDLIFTEEGLANMVEKCAAALRELRSGDDESG